MILSAWTSESERPPRSLSPHAEEPFVCTPCESKLKTHWQEPRARATLLCERAPCQNPKGVTATASTSHESQAKCTTHCVGVTEYGFCGVSALVFLGDFDTTASTQEATSVALPGLQESRARNCGGNTFSSQGTRLPRMNTYSSYKARAKIRPIQRFCDRPCAPRIACAAARSWTSRWRSPRSSARMKTKSTSRWASTICVFDAVHPQAREFVVKEAETLAELSLVACFQFA